MNTSFADCKSASTGRFPLHLIKDKKMTFTRKLLTLSAITALSLSLAACGDDGDSNSNNNNNNTTPGTQQTPADGTTCTAADAKCIGNIAITCNNGKSEKIDCQKEGKICDQATATCKVSNEPQPPTPTGECPKGTFKCDGNTLMGCPENAWTEVQKCADGTTCNATTGKCDAAASTPAKCDEATFPVTCPKSTQRRYCAGGQVKTEDCPAGQICKGGACIVCQDNEVRCNQNKVETCKNNAWTVTAECKDKTPICNAATAKCDAEAEVVNDDSLVVGSKCSCDDKDACNFTITGKDLSDAINKDQLNTVIPEGLLLAASAIGIDINAVLGGLNENVTITAPNFFSDKNVGCDNLKVDGMTTGCLRDATITFNGLNDLVKDILDKISTLGILTPAMRATLDKVLVEGIKFGAKDGYCLTAAINIVGDKEGLLGKIAPKLITADPDSLVNKHINTGNHEIAKKAACPKGAEHFSYTVHDETVGAVDVGFDMCLKACKQDSDCREGYTCYPIPNGVPSEGQTSADLPTKKACFDKATITYFTDMTNAFKKE